MKKRIHFILILMTLCVAGITGLQLYWNYQNYQTSIRDFRRDINESLRVAVDRETDRRQNVIVAKFKTWLYDTSFVQITANTKNRLHETVFTVKDTHPLVEKEKGFSLGIVSFKERLDSITPRARRIFIDHFTDRIVKEDLKKGILYFYTQRLGDSLNVSYEQSRLDTISLVSFYMQELSAKGIRPVFVMNPDKKASSRLYLTQPVNTALRRPFQKAFIVAGFQSPDVYLIRRMKWLLITSLLLIMITLTCFGYTISTLLSQHKLNNLKDDFISNMTHELNTPLSSIKITTEALKTMQLDEGLRKEYFDIITYQVDKLSGLTEHILHGQRLQKKGSVHKKRVELHHLIQNAIDDLSPQLQNTSAKISFTCPEPIHVNGDPFLLKNAFVNLIDNALKYSTVPPVILVSAAIRQKCAVIKFADNGIGIPAAYHAKIFDKFFRVPKGNLHNVKGYGLGLAYVKQVILQFQGTISVASNASAGTVFTIQIPLA